MSQCSIGQHGYYYYYYYSTITSTVTNSTACVDGISGWKYWCNRDAKTCATLATFGYIPGIIFYYYFLKCNYNLKCNYIYNLKWICFTLWSMACSVENRPDNGVRHQESIILVAIILGPVTAAANP
jgi:hypothetical protein